ncbi:MAG: hypothetical protein AAB654_05970, partial [Acidobacteriota bacterium]
RAPHRLPQVAVGGRSHGAGIQNHHIGRIQPIGGVTTLTHQSGLDRGSIGLRRPTAEILNVVLQQAPFLSFYAVWRRRAATIHVVWRRRATIIFNALDCARFENNIKWSLTRKGA